MSKVAAKRNAPESEASSKKSKTDKYVKTLSLSKSFVSTLTTKVHLSDAEAQTLADDLFKNADSINDALKY